MAMMLASRWWAVALRGVAAILFGILTAFSPSVSLYTLVLLFGGYAIVDGIFAIVAAFRGRAAERPWGSLLIQGIASIIAGVLTFMWPGITAMVLLVMIAVWAIVTGISELVAAVRLRKHIRGEWLLGLTGQIGSLYFFSNDERGLAIMRSG